MSLSERKLNRWSGHNYNLEGFYFITICIQDRLGCFGNIINQKMILNKYGKIAQRFWCKIPNCYQNITIDEFVIMPNHVHGIIIINPTTTVGTGQCPVPTGRYGLLSKIINSYKNVVTKQIHRQFDDYKFQWQRSFYDSIICDEEAMYNICEYIKNNSNMWARDRNKNV